jgi:hypothetical protein
MSSTVKTSSRKPTFLREVLSASGQVVDKNLGVMTLDARVAFDSSSF